MFEGAIRWEKVGESGISGASTEEPQTTATAANPGLIKKSEARGSGQRPRAVIDLTRPQPGLRYAEDIRAPRAQIVKYKRFFVVNGMNVKQAAVDGRRKRRIGRNRETRDSRGTWFFVEQKFERIRESGPPSTSPSGPQKTTLTESPYQHRLGLRSISQGKQQTTAICDRHGEAKGLKTKQTPHTGPQMKQSRARERLRKASDRNKSHPKNDQER